MPLKVSIKAMRGRQISSIALIRMMVGTFLVAGATGWQGGAVVTALLDAGIPVRALVRDVMAPPAVALAARGAGLAVGGFEDHSSWIDRRHRRSIHHAWQRETYPND